MIDELRELYQEVILDHGKNPRNFRHPEGANHQARGENPLCGDQLVVYLTIGADGRIADCAFQGQGCAISTASASMMTEMVKGKTEEEVKALFHAFHELCTKDDPDHAHDHVDEDDLDKLQVLAGVRQFPVRVKCATLAWHALDAAIAGQEKVSSE
jgi:nitrogen fixation protein NifU and related proteins